MSERLLDARGLKCPLPVLKTEKRIAALGAGERIVVLATDPMARIDIVHFCRQHGHAVALSEEGAVLRFDIEKAGA